MASVLSEAKREMREKKQKGSGGSETTKVLFV